MSLICIRVCNLFPFESLCTRTPFETEACSKSEMGYLGRCQKVKLPVPKFKIVLETSLACAECWGCFGGRETRMADANSSL